MKTSISQSSGWLLAVIILVGGGTSAFAQDRNSLSPITARQYFTFNTAPSSFSFTEPISLFATNFRLLAADDYPKPDFSGIEEWYEVVKYEYDFVDTLPKFVLVVKKKVENAPLHFEIKWFDEDGVVITKSVFPNLLTKASIPVGEPMRLSAYAPYERQMPKVKTVVVKKTSGQLNTVPG